jgi:hypothetical protein
MYLKIKSDRWQAALVLATLSVHLTDTATALQDHLLQDPPCGALALSVIAVCIQLAMTAETHLGSAGGACSGILLQIWNLNPGDRQGSRQVFGSKLQWQNRVLRKIDWENW